MFAGGLVPLAMNGAINFGVERTPTVDLITAALAVSGVAFALALFPLDLLEVHPAARDRLVEELDDGAVVVGPNGRIRDFNPTATRVLGTSRSTSPPRRCCPRTWRPAGANSWSRPTAKRDGSARARAR